MREGECERARDEIGTYQREGVREWSTFSSCTKLLLSWSARPSQNSRILALSSFSVRFQRLDTPAACSLECSPSRATSWFWAGASFFACCWSCAPLTEVLAARRHERDRGKEEREGRGQCRERERKGERRGKEWTRRHDSYGRKTHAFCFFFFFLFRFFAAAAGAPCCCCSGGCVCRGALVSS